MGVFEDFSNFLEARLEEFLRDNPDLELQALAEKLREQEEETVRLLAELRRRERQLQDEILATAQEVQRWHVRIDKAKAAGRTDLVTPAEEREAALLRQGNQLWGQMEAVKDRIKQSIDLNAQIQLKRKEVTAKVAEAQAAKAKAKAQQASQAWQNTNWNPTFTNPTDPLEQTFRRWEMDEELDQLKRQMGK
ncbi:TIGR04376 family protein [Microcoleus sp. FACHB-1515]|uniref:TIGR04376 family protein n=1 Tax=Cyanophyceae TaxID=3028117 RepID=UPI001685563B|nr:TIGR04376 family protein [Microcoleus sp. FACHB-1515]MBD2089342.1 TIGR04376 family protein [Microcoleus sp. FACHB-1515]